MNFPERTLSLRAKILLPSLLAAAFCALAWHFSYDPAAAAAEFWKYPSGGRLLAGIPGGETAWNLPLYPVFLAAVMNLGLNPALVFVGLRLGLYALVFFSGGLLRGWWAGIGALALTGLAEALSGWAYDGEQAFYALFLLMTLALLLAGRRKPTARNGVLAGLAAGAAMLVRGPLLLFPPLAALCDAAYGEAGPRTLFKRAALFLLASYILLLPWALFTRSVTGRVALAESGRAASNLIAGARGAIYTMEGDSARLAGPEGADGAFLLYARQFTKAPGPFLLAALRRAWLMFLFAPLLFVLALAAAALGREPDRLRIFCLPLYFFLVHSLVPFDARYLLPMLYLLPPLAAAGLVPERLAGPPGPAAAAVTAVFSVSLGLVLFTEVLVAAYPARAGRAAAAGSFSEALDRFPADANLRGLKCRLLWAAGDDAGFGKCLAGIGEYGDPAGACFLAAGRGDTGALARVPDGRKADCLAAKMLAELAAGDRAAGAETFRRAFAAYGASNNMLRAAPYAADRALADAIRTDVDGFFDRHVYRAVLFWPPERMAGLLGELERIAPFGGRLKRLQRLAAGAEDRGFALRLRTWIATDIFGLPLGEKGALWKQEGKKAKELSDAAVSEMLAGRPGEAEPLLLKAAELDPAGPEIFMNLCALRARQGRKAEAAEACCRAAEAVRLHPENRLPGYEALADEALRERARLLAGADGKSSPAAAASGCD